MCPGVAQAVKKLQEKRNRAVHEETETFYLIILVQKKSRFFFCTTTQGGHAMKKIWNIFKSSEETYFGLRRPTTRKGAGTKNPGNMWEKYTGRGKNTLVS